MSSQEYSEHDCPFVLVRTLIALTNAQRLHCLSAAAISGQACSTTDTVCWTANTGELCSKVAQFRLNEVKHGVGRISLPRGKSDSAHGMKHAVTAVVCESRGFSN